MRARSIGDRATPLKVICSGKAMLVPSLVCQHAGAQRVARIIPIREAAALIDVNQCRGNTGEAYAGLSEVKAFARAIVHRFALHRTVREEDMSASPSHPGHRAIRIIIPPMGLAGMLEVPAQAEATVVFAHGSGSSRHSTRNRQVAEALRQAGLATLLFDLLTEDEAADRRKIFDIGLLAQRLGAAVDDLADHAETRGLPIGLFGASTGAAAALVTAATHQAAIGAVVSRGGRPDLAGEEALRKVTAPTLLIVGGDDRQVLSLNEWARTRMTCHVELAIVPGATHLFEEAHALEQVARLAADWFRGCLVEDIGHVR
ncbi:dienelactone hydrolase family protein [Humitalea sp. 24SJ18S-53]|uniref:dienelactone hydrolase family protein n=1 Tax=Humitalea sp. 24SJ18S-53 TaxID=3422307 RepID=UPI003D678FBB